MADINFLSKEGLDRYDNNMKNYIGIELTKAEYDALSEEEKNKGTYWITDYSSSGGSSNIELDKTLSIEGKAADAQAVGKALGKKITLAEYLALPEEEQKTGAYWIEDANEPLGDGSRFLKTTDVVDNFDSSDSTVPLSAKKGKELYDNFSPKKFEYVYSSDIQTDVKNCIEQAISLYGTDMILNAFWLSKTSEGINAYSGMVTLVSNLSKLAIRIEGTYISSARDIVITFLYNVNDKTFIAFNNLSMPQKLNGACVFSPNQAGYIVSSMIPLANADKKNISITNNVTILGDEPIDIGASRFFISSYGTGFILCTKDTTAIETCAGKGVSFDFTVS